MASDTRAAADSAEVLPFGPDKGTRLNQLTTSRLRNALEHATRSGRCPRFREAAAQELARREREPSRIEAVVDD